MPVQFIFCYLLQVENMETNNEEATDNNVENTAVLETDETSNIEGN